MDTQTGVFSEAALYAWRAVMDEIFKFVYLDRADTTSWRNGVFQGGEKGYAKWFREASWDTGRLASEWGGAKKE